MEQTFRNQTTKLVTAFPFKGSGVVNDRLRLDVSGLAANTEYVLSYDTTNGTFAWSTPAEVSGIDTLYTADGSIGAAVTRTVTMEAGSGVTFTDAALENFLTFTPQDTAQISVLATGVGSMVLSLTPDISDSLLVRTDIAAGVDTHEIILNAGGAEVLTRAAAADDMSYIYLAAANNGSAGISYISVNQEATDGTGGSEIEFEAANADSTLRCTVEVTPDNILIDVTGTPVNPALLQLDSTKQGFLPPRMTTAQRDLIDTPVAGLTIYNTDTQSLNLYTSSWGEVGSVYQAPYYVYTVKLTQTGTNAPVATVVENTLGAYWGGTFTWVYDGVGQYSLDFSSAKDTSPDATEQCVVFMNGPTQGFTGGNRMAHPYLGGYDSNVTIAFLETHQDAVATNALLFEDFFEFRVYPA